MIKSKIFEIVKNYYKNKELQVLGSNIFYNNSKIYEINNDIEYYYIDFSKKAFLSVTNTGIEYIYVCYNYPNIYPDEIKRYA